MPLVQNRLQLLIAPFCVVKPPVTWNKLVPPSTIASQVQYRLDLRRIIA